MVMCFVPNCRHYSEQRTCKYFCFPANIIVKRKWIKLIGKDSPPSKYSLVCSCHFENGDRKNLPTIFDTENKTKICSPPVQPETKMQNNYPSGTKSAVRYITNSFQSFPGKPKNYFIKYRNYNSLKYLKKLSPQFGYVYIKNNDKQILMYTGIPSSSLFEVLFQLIEGDEMNCNVGGKVERVVKLDQMLMALMKFKLNLTHEELAVRFNINEDTVLNTIKTWLFRLYEELFKQVKKQTSSLQKLVAFSPTIFSTSTNCKIILDIMEVYSVVTKQNINYSRYKQCNTWKILVGVAPNGVITFVSQAYPKCISNQRIVQDCGILKKMKSGDLILADKGFLIKEVLPSVVYLNATLKKRKSSEELGNDTRRVAKDRVHVERAIKRMKRYQILDRIPECLIPHISMIVQTCAALTNFQHSIIREEKQ